MAKTSHPLILLDPASVSDFLNCALEYYRKSKPSLQGVNFTQFVQGLNEGNKPAEAMKDRALETLHEKAENHVRSKKKFKLQKQTVDQLNIVVQYILKDNNEYSCSSYQKYIESDHFKKFKIDYKAEKNKRKKTTVKRIAETTEDALPIELAGLYIGCFLRPDGMKEARESKIKTPVEVIAIVYFLINEDQTVAAKTSRWDSTMYKNEMEPDKCVYHKTDNDNYKFDTLYVPYQIASQECIIKYQLHYSLEIEHNQDGSIYLKGNASGFDPISGIPCCCPIIFKKYVGAIDIGKTSDAIFNEYKDKTPSQIFNQYTYNTVSDYVFDISGNLNKTPDEFTTLFLEDELFTFIKYLSGREYNALPSFLDSYKSIRHDNTLAGSYSMYMLSTDRLHLRKLSLIVNSIGQFILVGHQSTNYGYLKTMHSHLPFQL
ncbi:MAG: hypothetical protein IPJ79_10155 [Bacteroidetes bacterium]|nr:hypothetical protein [Bacteroidota bacterium]